MGLYSTNNVVFDVLALVSSLINHCLYAIRFFLFLSLSLRRRHHHHNFKLPYIRIVSTRQNRDKSLFLPDSLIKRGERKPPLYSLVHPSPRSRYSTVSLLIIQLMDDNTDWKISQNNNTKLPAPESLDMIEWRLQRRRRHGATSFVFFYVAHASQTCFLLIKMLLIWCFFQSYST